MTTYLIVGNAGTSMPVARNQLAPQSPGASQGEAPETIFACERELLAFGRGHAV